MEKILQQFQNDEPMREAVRQHFLLMLDKLALERVYSKQNTSDISAAKETIDKAFIELKEQYGKEDKTKVVNKAR